MNNLDLMFWGICRVVLHFHRSCMSLVLLCKTCKIIVIMNRFKISLADIIRSQYTDQVSLRTSLCRSYCRCVVIGFNSVNERLCFSGTPLMTLSPDVFALFWSGYQQFPIMAPWTKLVQSFFYYLFMFTSYSYVY